MNKQEKIKYIKLIVIFNLISIIIIFLVLKFGFSIAVKVSEYFQKDKFPVTEEENVYLSPPVIVQNISATSSPEVNIGGLSVPNNFVEIYLNDTFLKNIDVDSEGNFSTRLFLEQGNNKITAATKNNKGNLSPFSKEINIFFSNQTPTFEITEPQNNALIRKTEYIPIVGKTDTINKIYINEHLVILDKVGNFSYQVKLNPGDNTFNIVCFDPALNSSQQELKVRFQR